MPLDPVGLFPAAGSARRLDLPTGSKEVLSLGGDPPHRACDDLLAAFRAAGVREVLVLLRRGKWDIPAALGDGRASGLDLAYLLLEPTPSVPHTIGQALPLLTGRSVALGFPDILFRPHGALAQLLSHRQKSGADVSLALVPCDRPQTADLVETDQDGLVRRFAVKPAATHLGETWILATWGAAFTEFFATFLHQAPQLPPGRELAVSDVFTAALAAGLAVDTLRIPAGRYLDLGTRETLDLGRRGWPEPAMERPRSSHRGPQTQSRR